MAQHGWCIICCGSKVSPKDFGEMLNEISKLEGVVKVHGVDHKGPPSELKQHFEKLEFPLVSGLNPKSVGTCKYFLMVRFDHFKHGGHLKKLLEEIAIIIKESELTPHFLDFWIIKSSHEG